MPLGDRIPDSVAALLRGRGPLPAIVLVLTIGGAILLGGSGEDGEGARLPLVLIPLTLGLAASHGLVSGERRRGVLLLWIQKPVSPVLHYLGRYGVLQLLVGLLTLAALGVVVAVLGPIRPGVAGRVALWIPVLVYLGAWTGAVNFAFSSWGAHPDVLASSLYVAAGLYVGAVHLGRGGFGVVGERAWTVAIPLEPLGDLTAAVEGTGALSPGSLALLAAHLVVPTLLACVGILWTVRRPFPTERSR